MLAGAAFSQDVDYKKEFQAFKAAHSKSYSSDIEEAQRFGVFKANLDFIHEMNSKGNSFELGVTQFADLTADEFGQTHFGITQPEQPWGSLPSLGQHEYGGEALADSVDWTTKGAVTPVKNQGQCGYQSSYNFGRTLGGHLDRQF